MSKAVFVQKGEVIDYTAASALGYLDVVPLVTRIGVALEDIPVNGTGSVAVTGVYELPAVNNAAFAVGDALYWDATNGVLTKTATGNTPAGWCVEAKALAGTVAKVKIG